MKGKESEGRKEGIKKGKKERREWKNKRRIK